MSSDKNQQPFQKPGQQQSNWPQKGQQPPKPQGGQQSQPGQGAPSNRPPSQDNIRKK
jgi:hypothetical protein